MKEETTQPKRRGRGGRPRKSEAERRSEQQNIKLTKAESEYVLRMANALNITPCDLTRRALLGLQLPQPIPAVNLQVWAELRPLADELRRIINRIRSGEQMSVDSALAEKFFDAVQRLRFELRGDS
jgi:hypothetical protein